MDDEKRRSWRMGIERLKRATIDDRLRAAADQRRIALDLLKGGLRSRFPDLTEAEVESRMGEIVFGRHVWQEFRERRRRRLDGH